MSSTLSSRELRSNMIQELIWGASVPLAIRLASSESRRYNEADPYLLSCPRLTFLPSLLPQLLKFFSEDLITDVEDVAPDTGHFEFEGIPLKWQLPVGLLYDIYVLSTQDAGQGEHHSSSPKQTSFELTVHFAPSNADDGPQSALKSSEILLYDSFINSVKEADFLRSGSAKPIMSLSAEDSKALWTAAKSIDLITFSRIYSILLSGRGSMRNVPVKVFLPASPKTSDSEAAQDQDATVSDSDVMEARGHIKVIQSQIPPFVADANAATANQLRGAFQTSTQRQTVGTALHLLVPSLFPSKRTPILAKPILHGAVLPMSAILEELAVQACYSDGWLNIVVAVSS